MRDCLSPKLMLSLLLLSGPLTTGCSDDPPDGNTPSDSPTLTATPSVSQSEGGDTPTQSPDGPTATPSAEETATATPDTTSSPDITPTPGDETLTEGENTPTDGITATPGPTSEPTAEPTGDETSGPTAEPTAEPTGDETAGPTAEPTPEPTGGEPTVDPTAEPTSDPTDGETATPSGEGTPTADPTETAAGTPPDITPTPGDDTVTESPDATPTDGEITPTATADGTQSPDPTPTATLEPTATPTPSATPPLITPIPIRQPGVGDLIITEVQFHPRLVDDSDGEWLEIYNASTAILDVSGVRVQVRYDDDANDYGLSIADDEGDFTLVPGQSAVISYNADRDTNGQVKVDYTTSSRLGLYTSGWQLGLLHDDVLIDDMPYDAETFLALEGHSLERSQDSFTTVGGGEDPANWCVSFEAIAGSTDFGSPGQTNGICGVDADGDLYPETIDCADDNAAINGGMGEVPENSLDDDCDSEVDEDPAFGPGSMVVTEIMANPKVVGDSNGEWIEIHNPGATPINLQGWTIADAAQSHIIHGQLFVLGGGYVVLGNQSDPLSNGGYVPDYVVPGIAWNNDEESLTLSHNNLIVDQVNYDGSWPSDNGQSLSLDPTHYNPDDNDSPIYWCLASTEIAVGSESDLGSPGAVNPQCEIDIDGDGYDESEDCDDFDASTNPGAEDGPDDGLDQDCNGWDPTEAQRLVITEIMYGTGDDPDSEWFELWNPSIYTINLKGWIIEDNNAGNRHTIANDIFIDSDRHVVLGSDVEGRFQVDLDYAYGSGLRLSNTSDVVRLYNPNDTLMDEVTYSNGEPWPDLDSRTSIQLGQDAYGLDNNVAENWCNSTTTHDGNVTGTPGTRNTPCL